MTARARWLIVVVSLSLACSGSSNNQTPDSGPAKVTVKGTVISYLKRPVAGASVLIGAASTPTGADGSFTLNDVVTPYDVSVVVGSAKLAVVYQGLTRADPTVVLPSPDAPNRAATITGTVSGAVPTGQVAQAAFGSSAAVVDNWSTVNDWIPASGQITLKPAWHGASPIMGALHILRWTPGPTANHTQTPESFNGYLKIEPVTLTDKATADVGSASLQALTAQAISGSVSVPSGYVHDGRALTFQFSDGASMTMYDAYRGQLEANFSYATPGGVGATVSLAASASASTGETLYTCSPGHAPDATQVNVTLRAAPVANLPVDGASGVDTSTAFQWVAMGGAVHQVRFAPSGSTANAASYPTFYVYTHGASATIPNLATVGLPLTGAITYTWQVVGLAPFASVDDWAVANTPSSAAPAPCSADFQGGASKQRSFTTK